MTDTIIMSNIGDDLKNISETVKEKNNIVKKVRFNLDNMFEEESDEENHKFQTDITNILNNAFDNDENEINNDETELESDDSKEIINDETELESDDSKENINVQITNHYFGEDTEETYYEKIINYICSFTYPYSLYAKSLDIYHRYISYNLDANMSQITKHVYIGNISSAYHTDFLKQNNIEYIITVISDIPKINEDLISLNINIIDVPDNNIKTHFSLTNTFIETAIHHNKNILIHCVCGVSRSVTVFAAYLIHKLKINPTDAITYIKSRRPIANPNKGFMIQLDEYYNNIINKVKCYSSKELYNIAFRDL